MTAYILSVEQLSSCGRKIIMPCEMGWELRGKMAELLGGSVLALPHQLNRLLNLLCTPTCVEQNM